MVRLMVLDTDNPAVKGVPDNSAKGEKMILEPSISSAQRRKLADISNLQDQTKVMNQGANLQQHNIVISYKEYTERLQKENVALMKVLAERNKIIELSGIELQKLRINLQKMQEQNFQLAQANSQMLAELNVNKDRLKALQHEIGCKNGLLKVIKMQLEERTVLNTHHASRDKVGANVLSVAYESFQADDMDQKNSKRKRQSRIKSSGSSVVKSMHVNERTTNKSSEETCQTKDGNKKLVRDEANAVKETNNKRHCGRRQSASFACQEAEKTENLHEMADAKVMEENTRPPLRRQSARLKSQQPELSSDNLHQTNEFKEATKSRRASVRRQSKRTNFEEPKPNEKLSDGDGAQEATGDEGCHRSAVRRGSVGSKSEALLQPAGNWHETDTHDTKETTRKRRTSTRRHSMMSNPQVNAAADGGIIDQKSTDPCFSNQLRSPGTGKDNDEETKNSLGYGETEGTRRISVGRPSRQAAVKIQSYKEVSLKVKMRRSEQ
ncbi:PREDICTED: shugoshin-1-like isoform X2 [Tarenaya hassleriana]|uniref:shugoshin-1-like isoform X2 n=1 Tax=Tarenaya hassleriana TaxID=28532 RepID=UPI00053C2C7B|nr:PREDICTED: shugoshin-1-like isoform X2 [Tarenaya hassleriana]